MCVCVSIIVAAHNFKCVLPPASCKDSNLISVFCRATLVRPFDFVLLSEGAKSVMSSELGGLGKVAFVSSWSVSCLPLFVLSEIAEVTSWRGGAATVHSSHPEAKKENYTH